MALLQCQNDNNATSANSMTVGTISTTGVVMGGLQFIGDRVSGQRGDQIVRLAIARRRPPEGGDTPAMVTCGPDGELGSSGTWASGEL